MPSTKSPVVIAKEYPEAYPKDAIRILDAMSFGKDMMLVGSMSLRSQQYAGDYDGYEVVQSKGAEDAVLHKLADRFKAMIRELQKMKDVFIGDIKAGVVPEWRVLPLDAQIVDGKVVGYNAAESRAVVKKMLENDVITEAAAKEAMSLLPTAMKPLQLLHAKNKLKFHVVRWKPAEVLKGSKKLVDGSTMTLEQAFSSPGIAKMDVIGLVNNSRFTDFSVIYQFRIGAHVLNDEPMKIDQSLRENILGLKEEGNYFKALKRMFALAKYNGDGVALEELHNVLNSDLGRLYQIIGDIGTLQDLLESHPDAPMETIRFEIDQFIGRLSTIYTLKDYLKDEPRIHKEIRKLITLPRASLVKGLESLGNYLDGILQSHAGKWLKSF